MWMKGYAVEIQQLKDGHFLAHVVELGHSACSACGRTMSETFLTLEEVLNDLLKVMEENGDPIPEPLGDPGNPDDARCHFSSVAQQLWGELRMVRDSSPCPECGQISGHKEGCALLRCLEIFEAEYKNRRLK